MHHCITTIYSRLDSICITTVYTTVLLLLYTTNVCTTLLLITNLMMEAIATAIRLLSSGSKGNVLTLNYLADHDDPSKGTV